MSRKSIFFSTLLACIIMLGGKPQAQEAPLVKTKLESESGNKAGKKLSKTETLKRKKKKTALSFAWKKFKSFSKIFFYIMIAVFLTTLFEAAGLISHLRFLFKPILKLGRLNDSVIPAFFAAIRSSTSAYGILVSAHQNKELDSRQLYTGVLTSASITALGHMPGYFIGIATVLGIEACIAAFLVRVGASIAFILFVLLISSLVISRFYSEGGISEKSAHTDTPEYDKKDETALLIKIKKRMLPLVKRILLYLVPVYIIVGILQYNHFFKNLSAWFPGLFSLSFLPPESTAILPALAVNFYTALGTAEELINNGNVTAKQVMTILLVGSVITAPVRTLKRIVPTYIGMLGFRGGVTAAVSSQLLRMAFLIIGIVIMWMVW
ncbi:MAG: hypothetical protein ACYTFY_17000 [Planctomycetota bacterium]